MRILDLNHVSLIVRDLNRSRKFYCGVLGMEEVARPPTFKFDGAWVRSGSAELHLIQRNHAAQEPGDREAHPTPQADQARARHLGLAVEDMDDALRTLAAHGVKVVLGPRPRGDGALQSYCFDPDGHLVELHTLPREG